MDGLAYSSIPSLCSRDGGIRRYAASLGLWLNPGGFRADLFFQEILYLSGSRVFLIGTGIQTAPVHLQSLHLPIDINLKNETT